MTSPEGDRQGSSRGFELSARTSPARSAETTLHHDVDEPRWGVWRFGLICLLLAPYPVMLLIDGDLVDRMISAGRFSLVMTDMMMIAAATLLAYDARIGRNPGSSCLATAIVFLTLQDLPMALLASYDESFTDHIYELSPAHAVASLVALVLFARVSGRLGVPRTDPLVTGTLLGGVAALSHLLLIVSGRDHLAAVGTAGGLLILAVVGVAFVLALAVIGTGTMLPVWATRRLVAAIVLYAVARFAPAVLGVGSPRWWSVLLIVVTGVILLGIAARQLRQTTLENQRLTESYAHLAETARADLERDREVGHEMTSIVAGIAAASNLLTEDGHRRTGMDTSALQEMIAAETARLHRLSSDRSADHIGPVPLDNVLAPLVVAQTALGHPVQWRPHGHQVLARRDALSEVLNILLTNAARHAGGAVTTVTACQVGPRVEIRVSDQGPGVAPELTESLFEWGVRGPVSPGQGIGLQLARRLMHAAGGTVALEQDRFGAGSGATFVVSLPVAQPDTDDAHELQHLEVAG